MTKGCVACHHEMPQSEQHPPCKTCHGIAVAGTDIYKPGLKGAYHQQCVNCHRQWMDATDCEVCHKAKAGMANGGSVTAVPTKDDILAQMPSPIPEPDTEFYRSDNTQAVEGRVVFRHQEHVDRFGLNCADCHHEPDCARCHAARREPAQLQQRADHHKPCISCHQDDMDLAARSAGKCKGCHWREGEPKPEPFTHASTGWPLGRYHADKSCRACHTAPRFVKLDRDCNTCHSGWSSETFDHAITGQLLDETHAEADCGECHVNRAFHQPPTCSECHDEEDDGVSFPVKRPGAVAMPK